ncbi:MAG: class I SAM-dependent methyltransferase [Rhodospirillales bacterium]
MIDVSTCIVCGGERRRLLYPSTFDGSVWDDAIPYFLTNREKAVHGDIVQCADCGFVYTSPQFEAAEYARIYANISISDQGTNDRSLALRYENLARLVNGYCPEGRFLDLGCGNGGFLNAMPSHDGVGFEIRQDGLGVTVQDRIVIGDFLGYARQRNAEALPRFDFVTAWDVLEHIPDLDAHMSGVADIVAPDGYFFVTLPDIGSLSARIFRGRWNCVLLEHLWYFSLGTFEKYAHRFGFNVVDSCSFPYPCDIQTLANRVSQTWGLPRLPLPALLGRQVIKLGVGLMGVVLKKRAV